MIRRLLIGIVTVLFLAGPLWAQEEFDAINLPDWGTSLEQVMARHTGGALAEQDKLILHYKFADAAGDLDEVYYYFTDKDELGAVSVYYATDADRDGADLVVVYNALKDRLTRKYGTPKYDFGPDEAVKFDPNMAHLTDRHAVWHVAGTYIMLSVREGKIPSGVFLNCNGTEYFEYF